MVFGYLCFTGFCCLPLLPRVCCLSLSQWGCAHFCFSWFVVPLLQWVLLPTFASVGLYPPCFMWFVAHLCICGFRTNLCWPPLAQNDVNSLSIGLVSSIGVVGLVPPPRPPPSCCSGPCVYVCYSHYSSKFFLCVTLTVTADVFVSKSTLSVCFSLL
jgi:hypothetical protein